MKEAAQLLTLSDVLGRVALSKSMVYKLMGAEKFPKPRRIGGSSRWRESDINDWINSDEEVAV